MFHPHRRSRHPTRPTVQKCFEIRKKYTLSSFFLPSRARDTKATPRSPTHALPSPSPSPARRPSPALRRRGRPRPPLPPPASTVGGRPRKRCVSYRSPFCPPIASGSWGNLRWLFRLVVPCHLLLLLLPMMMLLLPSSSSSCCCRCPGGQFHGAPPRVMAPRRGVTRGTVCSITRVFLVPRVFFCYQRDI